MVSFTYFAAAQRFYFQTTSMNRYTVFFCAFWLIGAACNNHEEAIIRHVDPDEVWLDYQVWGEESKENVTVMLQFRTNHSEKDTRLLEEPAGVAFDGEDLKADSSKMTGFYYEMEKPLQTFAGKHTILFRDFEGKEYVEKFSFQPFWLEEEIPQQVGRTGLNIQLKGLEKESYIRIIALDTVFRSNGINDVDTVKNGQLILSEKRLRNLKNGPVHIEIFQEEEWPLKNSWKGGGRLSLSYGLKRDFELID